MPISSKLLLIGIGTILMVGSGAYMATHKADISSNVYKHGCTLEAKICPDGSTVGRVGVDCEFAECTSSTTTSSPAGASIGKKIIVHGTSITVLELLEDSRCPVDVQCIQAGTVRIRAAINAYNRDFIFVLGHPEQIDETKITLTSVIPSEKHSVVGLNLNQYRFVFTVVPIEQTAKGFFSGTLSIGPICPVERMDVTCKPSSETYAMHKVYVYKSDKKTLMATLTPDAQGKFSIPLNVGDYWVDVMHQAVGGVSGAPASVHITANIATDILINIDTGIR